LAGCPVGRIWNAWREALPTGPTIVDFALPTEVQPYSITTGPDGNVWYLTDRLAGPTIGRFNPQAQTFTDFASSASPAITQTVTRAVSTTSVTSAPSSSVVGQMVTLTSNMYTTISYRARRLTA
jgi:streptogramin lyase